MKSILWNPAETVGITRISKSMHCPYSGPSPDVESNRGIDYVRGSLNWGPISFINAVSKTFGWWTQRRTDYGEAFHTYVLEWTSDFLYVPFYANATLLIRAYSRIYVDNRLQYMLSLSFSEPFFARGQFPPVVENGTTPIVLQNPWVNGTNATPFDQRMCFSCSHCLCLADV